jgi:transposase
LAALVAELSGPQRDSRSVVQEFCTSILGVPINRGAIQRAVDRVAEALKPYYEAITEQARWAKLGHWLAPPDHSLIVIVGGNSHP